MRVWRLCRLKWAERPLDGEGARRVGGRWGPRGVPMVYCAESLSLAALECLLHFDVPDAPEGWVTIAVEVPADVSVDVVTDDDLAGDWRRVPAGPETVRIGESWAVEGRSLILSVPSVVVPSERSYLINPLHEEIGRVRAMAPEPFAFDPRSVPPSG